MPHSIIWLAGIHLMVGKSSNYILRKWVEMAGGGRDVFFQDMVSSYSILEESPCISFIFKN